MSAKQTEMIISHLLQGGKENGLTALQAMVTYGVGRLASRIHDLRAEGYLINRELIDVPKSDGTKTTVAKYWIDPQNATFKRYWYDMPRGVRVVTMPNLDLVVQIFNADGEWETIARKRGYRIPTKDENQAYAKRCIPDWDERRKGFGEDDG